MELCATVDESTTVPKEENQEEFCTTVDLELKDPCDPPAQLDRVAMANQVYQLNDKTEPSYVHPEFTITPAYCPIDYTYSITSLLDGDTAFFKEPENNDRTSVFKYTKDNAPLGQTQTVTVTATSTSKYNSTPSNPKTDAGTWDLTFTNPCDDASAITITSVAQND